MSHFSLEDVESCLQRKSWWAVIFILPLARRLSLFFAKRTALTPNQITLASFAFVPLAAICYAHGGYFALLAGAFLFELNYLLDCVDGTLARLKGTATAIGGYVDSILDRLRIVILGATVAWGQYHNGSGGDYLFWMILYLGVNSLIINSRAYQEKALLRADFPNFLASELVAKTETGILSRWLNFAQRRNLVPYYHDVELDALVFVVGPVLGKMLFAVRLAVALGVILLILLNLLFLLSIKKVESPTENEDRKVG